MKTKALLAALLVLTCLVAASCQKEPAPEPQPTTPDAAVAYTVIYSIDGQSNTMVVNGEGELTAFLRYLNRQARHGHSVEIALEGVEGSAPATKDTQTITGASESEILAWETARLREGYRVTITFDADTGTYSGVAIKTLSALQLEGTVWRGIRDYYIRVHSMSYHFKEEETFIFSTSNSGARVTRAIIVSGYPAEEVYGEDYEGDTVRFQYTVINNSVTVNFSTGTDVLQYNPTINALVIYIEGSNYLGEDRIVLHQVRD